MRPSFGKHAKQCFGLFKVLVSLGRSLVTPTRDNQFVNRVSLRRRHLNIDACIMQYYRGFGLMDEIIQERQRLSVGLKRGKRLGLVRAGTPVWCKKIDPSAISSGIACRVPAIEGARNIPECRVDFA